jgi:oxygen-dependent protoporphyrinogen oxidase
LTVAVVGAGAVGLAVAVGLARAGRDVVVFEASDRAGGVVRTRSVEGALVEQGPQSVRAGAAATNRLVETLGLTGQVVGPSPDAARRFLLLDGALTALPSGPLGWLTGNLLPSSALVRAMGEPWVARGDASEESVSAFFSRRFGVEVARRLVDPFVGGIYAGDASQLEMISAFPDLVALEQAYGSVVGGLFRRRREKQPDWAPRVTFTFDGGVQQLTDAMCERLGSRLKLGDAVSRVVRSGGAFTIEHASSVTSAEHVVMAVPPRAAREILPDHRAAFEGFSDAAVAAIHLGWRAGDGPPQRGFGWLAPSFELRDALGAIWVSRTFPHLCPGWDVVRVMVGGARDPVGLERDDEGLCVHAIETLRRVQGPVSEPLWSQVARHEPGIPQYSPGHAARVRRIQSLSPNLHFVGWGYTGIGLSQGFEEAERLVDRLISAHEEIA